MNGLFGVGKSTFPSRQFLKKGTSIKVLRMHRNKFKYKEKLDEPSKIRNELSHCTWTLGMGSHKLRTDPWNNSFCLALPGGPVVENPPSNAGDTSLVPGQATKIPHATRQLALHTPQGRAAAETPCSQNF